MARLQLQVNGTRHNVEIEPGNRLLYVLRDQLNLHGPKFGCGLGQCGACMVLVDGALVNSCMMAASEAAGHAVVTIEGLGTAEHPHPLQQVFVEEQAAQCGYCIPGMIIAAKALLDRTPNPTDAAIRSALAGNLCGCGTHLRILRAIKRAVKEMG